MSSNVEQILDFLATKALELKVGDIHLKEDEPPFFRTIRGIEPIKFDSFNREMMRALIYYVLSEEDFLKFNKTGEADGSYVTSNNIRIRVNCFKDRGKFGMAMRVIPTPPNLASLGLDKIMKPYANLKEGIIFVTGPTGSGKSSTLAGMITKLSKERLNHIVTIEDPIEFVYNDRGRSIITQREIGTDTDSFSEALRRVLRQDPDVIVIGEARDAETLKTALAAAETGHLVFTTLHSTNVKETLSRVLEMFPQSEHDYIRLLLAGSVKGIISQKLIASNDNKKIPIIENLVSNVSVAEAIKLGNFDSLIKIMEKDELMQTFNQSLLNAVLSNQISQDTALSFSSSPQNLKLLIEQKLGTTSTIDNKKFKLNH